MKKVLYCILTIILSFSLASCNQGGSTSEKANIDLKGKTIRISNWGDIKPAAGTKLGDLRLASIKAAEQKYNCKFEYVVISDMSKILTAAQSNDIAAEVISTTTSFLPKLWQSGYIYAIDDIGDINNPIYEKTTLENSKYNGKTYSVAYDPRMVHTVMFFNKSMLEREGYPLPYDLVAQKKWNFDEWLKMMKATTHIDKNQFGSGDVFPAAIVYGNGASFYAQKDSKYIQNMTDPKLVRAMEFLQNAHTKEKVLEKNVGTIWDFGIKEFAKGRYATVITGLFAGEYWLKENMSDEYGLLPVPMGPDAKEYLNSDQNINSFVIPSALPKEEAKTILKAFDEAYKYPLDKLAGQISYYETYLKDKESVEIAKMLTALPLTIMKEYCLPDLRLGKAAPLEDLIYIMYGDKPVLSTLESHSNTIQAQLDEFYKQK